MRINNLYRYLNNKTTHKACILYGNNINLITLYSILFKQHFREKNAKIQYFEKLNIYQAQQIDLFASDTDVHLLICDNLRDSDFPKVLEILSILQSNEYLLLIAEGWNTQSKIVKYFNANDDVCAAPCYDISSALLREMIVTEAKKINIQLPIEQIALMIDKYSTFPEYLIQDFYKIQIFLSKGKSADTPTSMNQNKLMDQSVSMDKGKLMSNEELQGIINHHNTKLQQEILNCILLKNIKGLMYYFNFQGFQDNFMLNIRYIIKNLMIFGEFLAHKKYDQSNSDAMQNMKNKVFFGHKDLFAQAVPSWSIERVNTVLEKLLMIELHGKIKEQSIATLCQSLINY